MDSYKTMLQLAQGLALTVWLCDWRVVRKSAMKLAAMADAMVQQENERNLTRKQLQLPLAN